MDKIEQQIKFHRTMAALMMAVGVLALGGTVYYWSRLTNPPRPAVTGGSSLVREAAPVKVEAEPVGPLKVIGKQIDATIRKIERETERSPTPKNKPLTPCADGDRAAQPVWPCEMATSLGITTSAWVATSASTRLAEIYIEARTFTLYSADGSPLLMLKEDERGDPVHERFATAILMMMSGRWDVKDWREALPKKSACSPKLLNGECAVPQEAVLPAIEGNTAGRVKIGAPAAPAEKGK